MSKIWQQELKKMFISELLEKEIKEWKQKIEDLNNNTLQSLKDKLVGEKLHIIRRDLGILHNQTKEMIGKLTDIERCSISPDGLPEFLFVFDGHNRVFVNSRTEIIMVE